jgi:single-strand DNA-binding protein
MINRCIIVGRMVRDPELRRTGNGNAILNFTLALDNYGGGEKSTDFIPVTAFNKMATNIAQYCSKGSLVGVDGKIHSNTYQNKDGKNVTYINVVADNVRFMDTRKSQSNAQPQQEGNWNQNRQF